MDKIKTDRRDCQTFPHARVKEQKALTLDLLREGPLNKRDAITGSGRLQGRIISQISARIFELESDGYVIAHLRTESSLFVTFVLISEPNQQQKNTEAPEQLGLGIPNKPATTSDFADFERGVK